MKEQSNEELRKEFERHFQIFDDGGNFHGYTHHSDGKTPAEWWLNKLSTERTTLIEEILAEIPKEKDISLNKIGTVGDYHTHGYNEYHDAVRSILFSHLESGNEEKK